MSDKKVSAKRKTNLLKLFSSMGQLTVDAVDKEIVKRFKVIIDTMEEDITKTTLQAIMKQPENLDLTTFREGVQPYIRHYIFMVKRATEKAK